MSLFGSNSPDISRALQLLGATLQDASAGYNGRPGGAVQAVQQQFKKLADQKQYQDTISGLFGAQNINNVQATPQMPMTGAGAELANRQYAGAYNQPTYGGAIGGLSNETQDMLARMLPTMDPNQGMSMLFNSITSGQERADRKGDVLQQNAWQNQAADRNRQQTVQDNTVRPATPEEKKRFGYNAATPVFIDGFGKPIVTQDPNAITPLQRAQLGIQQQQLGIQQKQLAATQAQAGDQALSRKLANAKTLQELKAAQNTQRGQAASYDTAIATLDRLTQMPGFSAAVGANIPLLDGIPFYGAYPGSKRADFEAELDAFKAQTFLPMVQQLKGMGALSNAEGEKLTNAVGALSTNMSEEAFKQSVARIKADLVAARARAGGVDATANTSPNASKAPTVSNW